MASVRGRGEDVASHAWSPDGARLASAGWDAVLRVWSADDLAPLALLPGSRKALRCVAWSESQGLVTAGADGVLRLWPAPADPGPDVLVRNRSGESLWSVAPSPDGESWYGASFDGTVVQWDLASTEETRRWTAHPEASCHGLSLTADGRRLLSCSWDGTARLWSLPEAAELQVFDPPGGVYDCALSRDGRFAAATAGDHLWVWDAATGEVLHHLDTGAGVTGLAFDAAGERVAVACADGHARMLEVGSAGAALALDGGHGSVSGVAFSPDGRSLAASTSAGALLLFDLAHPGDEPRILWSSDQALRNPSWSPDGRRIAVTSEFLDLVDVVQGGLVLRLHPHRDSTWKAVWTADGQTLLSCSSDGTVAVLRSAPPALAAD